MGGRTLMRHRAAWVMILAPAMSLAGIGMATAGQASVQGQARMAASHAVHHATSVKPNKVNQLDCNGLSTKYKALKRTGPATCTDPFNPRGKKVNGKLRGGLRFEDNDHYIGHDEPSVKFISHSAGSGNTMTYLMKLPVDPKKAPTATGSVTKYGELSIAPWFGLPLCDPNAGFTTRIDDLTTHQSGFMIASAKNGFMNTNVNTCAGTPHTFHAEYATAAQQNQVPWAALEGGVLMQQEIGHFESCNSVANQFPLS